jgi:hypothetical protein
MLCALKIGIPNTSSTGAGGAFPDVTATLTVIGTSEVQPNTTSVIVRITLSEMRGVNTSFAIVSENEFMDITVNPTVITAGDLTEDFVVETTVSDGPTPFDVSATADGVTVLNSVELTWAAPP